jgi:hypothetical protein
MNAHTRPEQSPERRNVQPDLNLRIGAEGALENVLERTGAARNRQLDPPPGELPAQPASLAWAGTGNG